MGNPRIVMCAAAVAISNKLNIDCGTEQSEGPSTKHPPYLIKDLDGSNTTLIDSVDLQGQYVSVFAHIYEPVRSAKLPGQSHGPYSTHACVARYFVDGTPPEKGGAAGSMFHRFSVSCRRLPSATPPRSTMAQKRTAKAHISPVQTNRQCGMQLLPHKARRHLVLAEEYNPPRRGPGRRRR